MEAKATVWRASRDLYVTALLIFALTIIIGIVRGIDLVAFAGGEGVYELGEDIGRQLILTHLHAGTLGFITLAVVAGAFRMFTEGREVSEPAASQTRALGVALAVAVTVYIAAFVTTQGILRPIAGSMVFLVVLWLFWWVWTQTRGYALTVPQLAMLGAFLSLVVGALFGILLGIFVSEGSIPGVSDEMGPRIGESHPGTMIIGYLILAGFGLIEWLITDEQRSVRSNKWGAVQVGAVFLAGVMVLIGILADSFEIAGLNVPFELIGAVIFLVRMRRELAPSRWLESVPSLYGRLATIWLILGLVLLGILINGLVSGEYADFEDVPRGLFLSLDHINFVGVMAMVTYGLVAAVTPPMEQREWWVLAGMNVGLAFFIIGLLLDEAVLKRIGTPILGIALLIGIWLYVSKLLRATPVAVEASQASG